MKRSIKLMSLLVVIFLAMFFLSGCWYYGENTEGKITGGGWFMNLECNQTNFCGGCEDWEETGDKCTFGFNAHGLLLGEHDECCTIWGWNMCWTVEDWDFKGQFQFNDHAETKVHAEVDGLLSVYKTQRGEDPLIAYEFTGLTKKDEIPVKVYIAPDGNSIKIVYDEDEWQGELSGGNITIH